MSIVCKIKDKIMKSISLFPRVGLVHGFVSVPVFILEIGHNTCYCDYNTALLFCVRKGRKKIRIRLCSRLKNVLLASIVLSLFFLVVGDILAMRVGVPHNSKSKMSSS